VIIVMRVPHAATLVVGSSVAVDGAGTIIELLGVPEGDRQRRDDRDDGRRGGMINARGRRASRAAAWARRVARGASPSSASTLPPAFH
jgi:hypothetical protein